MYKLISAELYKLRKLIYYKILLLVSVIYAVTDIYFSHIGLRGYDSTSGLEAFIYSFTMWGVFLLISGICAGVFIAGDFNNRILHSEIAVGHSRRNIFFAKVFTYWIAGMGIVFAYQIIDVLGITCLFDLGHTVTFCEFMLLMRLELCFLLIFSAFLSVCVLVAFWFRTLFSVTAIEVVWILFGVDIFAALQQSGTLIKYLYNHSIFHGIQALTLPLYEEYVGEYGLPGLKIMPLDEAFAVMQAQHYAKYIIISLITIFITLAVAYQLFRRAELK